jgi:hypothetical protein
MDLDGPAIGGIIVPPSETSFDREDFLGQGGGAAEATGMVRTSSTGSSPGGGL